MKRRDVAAALAVLAVSLVEVSHAGAAELQDSASGAGLATVPDNPSPITFAFDATSGPNGENATGTYSIGRLVDGEDAVNAAGPVDCLQISPADDEVAFIAGPIASGYYFDNPTSSNYTYAGFNVYDFDPLNDPLTAIQPDQISGLRLYGDAPGEQFPGCDSFLGVPGLYDVEAGFIDVMDDEPVTAPGPATVMVSPPDAVNEVGTTHTVTATVRDAGGAPVPGATVLFTATGSSNASGSCTTGAAGQCNFTYTGPQLAGADIISGCADANGNGSRDPGEPCGEATKAWILPTSTPGQTTGGGQLFNTAGNDKIAFGYNAKSTASGLQGNCTVVDPSPTTNVKIKCLDVTTLVQSGTHATFFGNATVNGTPTTYRIDVDDFGEPGAGIDAFRIQTSSGYTAGGTITNGNIQIHN